MSRLRVCALRVVLVGLLDENNIDTKYGNTVALDSCVFERASKGGRGERKPQSLGSSVRNLACKT